MPSCRVNKVCSVAQLLNKSRHYHHEQSVYHFSLCPWLISYYSQTFGIECHFPSVERHSTKSLLRSSPS
jgi:hypothetical protein